MMSTHIFSKLVHVFSKFTPIRCGAHAHDIALWSEFSPPAPALLVCIWVHLCLMIGNDQHTQRPTDRPKCATHRANRERSSRRHGLTHTYASSAQAYDRNRTVRGNAHRAPNATRPHASGVRALCSAGTAGENQTPVTIPTRLNSDVCDRASVCACVCLPSSSKRNRSAYRRRLRRRRRRRRHRRRSASFASFRVRIRECECACVCECMSVCVRVNVRV